MILQKRNSKLPEIDLTGPNGNVFVLIANAKNFAKQLGLNGQAIIDDMMKKDYDHAIDVFEENFGEYVVLYR